MILSFWLTMSEGDAVIMKSGWSCTGLMLVMLFNAVMGWLEKRMFEVVLVT